MSDLYSRHSSISEIINVNKRRNDVTSICIWASITKSPLFHVILNTAPNFFSFKSVLFSDNTKKRKTWYETVENKVFFSVLSSPASMWAYECHSSFLSLSFLVFKISCNSNDENKTTTANLIPLHSTNHKFNLQPRCDISKRTVISFLLNIQKDII